MINTDPFYIYVILAEAQQNNKPLFLYTIWLSSILHYANIKTGQIYIQLANFKILIIF